MRSLCFRDYLIDLLLWSDHSARRISCRFLIGLLFLISSAPVQAQHQDCLPDKPRFLLIGDSWYGIMYAASSYLTAFDRYGFPDMRHSVGAPVINGATLELTAENITLNLIEQTIADHPEVDLVGISLGGNDYLGGWSVDMWDFQENAFFSQLRAYLHAIVQRIQSVRPGIHIFFSGYDYPNFVETASYPGSPYLAQWEGMGEPSVLELNTGLARLEQLKIDLADQDPTIHYVHAMGLMQHIYGYPIGLPVPPYLPFDPGLTPLPGQEDTYYAPYPGGLPNYPSPLPALNWQGLDGIHLTEEAYLHLADWQTRHFFFDHFRASPEATFTAEPGPASGWIDDQGNTGTEELLLGEESAGRAYRSLLSFETGALPDDAEIEAATLFLKRRALSGANPISGDLGAVTLDAGNPLFGQADLEASDFDEAAGMFDAGCFAGSVSADGHYLRVALSQEALDLISRSGNTQFRIAFDNSDVYTESLMAFHLDGPDAPFLDVHYTVVTSSGVNEGSQQALKVFPNPTSGKVRLEWNGSLATVRAIRIYNARGEIVANLAVDGGNSITADLGGIASGMYRCVVLTGHHAHSANLLVLPGY